MNFEPVKSASKCLCLWLVLVGVVLLLTLLFNFFGTLSCAALTAMMLGAIKHRRWLTLPISAVFPGVVFALMHFSKVELEGSKRIVVPALCFGAFWVTYFVTCAMMGSEARSARSRAESHPGTKADSEQPDAELHLDQLQGRWNCESAGRDGQNRRKAIEITGDHLVLREFDLAGRERLRVEADVRLEDLRASRVLVVSRETKSNGKPT